VAALNVVIAVNSVAFMPAWGLASAGAILPASAASSPLDCFASLAMSVATDKLLTLPR